MFRTRLISGIALVAVLIATGILGGNILWGFCFLISMIGLHEFYKVFKIEKSIGLIGYGLAIVYYLSLLFYDGSVNGALFMAIMLMLAAGVYVLQYPKFNTEQVFAGIIGFLYLPLMLSYIYQIRVSADGLYSLWLILSVPGDVTHAHIAWECCLENINLHQFLALKNLLKVLWAVWLERQSLEQSTEQP